MLTKYGVLSQCSQCGLTRTNTVEQSAQYLSSVMSTVLQSHCKEQVWRKPAKKNTDQANGGRAIDLGTTELLISVRRESVGATELLISAHRGIATSSIILPPRKRKLCTNNSKKREGGSGSAHTSTYTGTHAPIKRQKDQYRQFFSKTNEYIRLFLCGSSIKIEG